MSGEVVSLDLEGVVADAIVAWLDENAAKITNFFFAAGFSVAAESGAAHELEFYGAGHE